MPIVAAANNYLLAIDKQANEATVSSTADYSVPVFSADIGPRYDLRRVEVTDAASLEGDPYKSPTHWEANVEFPAFSRSLGTFLQSLWPTDTTTGGGPFTHTFSGLGGTQSWISLYSEWPGASAFEQTFGKGLASGITFSADQEGGPLRVGFRAFGQETTVANYSATTADTLADGYFLLQTASASIEADFDTPNVNPAGAITNVRNVSISVDRNVTPEPTATGVNVSQLSQGKVTVSGSMEMLWNDWEAYRASYFGAVGGSTVSATIVYGALALNFRHSVTADTFEVYVPKVQFRVTSVTPSPAGDALVVPVELHTALPSAGSVVQPILVNSVSASY